MVRVTMLDPMNMTLGHTDSSSLDLLPKSFGLLVLTFKVYGNHSITGQPI